MNKRKLFLWAFAGLLGAMGLSAQEIAYSKMSPSTRILLNKVAKKDTSDSQLRSIMSADKLPVFVQVENESGWDALYAAGCEIQTRVDDIATALIPLSLVEKLSEHPGIGYIQAAEKVSLLMDSARRVSNVQPAHVGTGLSHPYTGKDVLVGVVDVGFDFKHPNFYDKSGKNYRIKRVLDQKRPKGQQEFTTQEAILAAGQSYDSAEDQHGTHVAGIAAGSGADTPYKGVAPESDLLLVATHDFNNTEILNGVDYIFRQAEAAGKPCVVNLSLGENLGPHDGTAMYDLAIDKMVGPGRIVAIAVGNQRLKKEHVATLSPADTLRTFVPKMALDVKSEIVDVWADQPGEEFTYSLSLYEDASKEIIASTNFLSLQDSTIVLWSRDSTRKYVAEAHHQLYKNNGKHNMRFYFTYPEVETFFEEIFLLEVATKKTPVRAWCQGSSFTDLGLGAPYKAGNGEYSIASPGSAREAISVGAYVSRDTISNIYGQKGRTDHIYNELTNSSSIGPTIDNRIKPDVSAPGSMLYSSYNSVYAKAHKDSTYMVATSTFEGKTYPWGMMQGTSMSCPFVTGSIALWLQANPTLTPEDIKKVLSRTSVKDKEMTYPNSFWGAGKIDVYKGLLDILNITSNEDVFADSPEEAVCVYAGQTPGSFHIRWANMPKAFTVHVHGMDGRHWYGEKVDTPVSVDYAVSAGPVPAGVYVITINTADGVVTRKLSF